MRNRTLVVCSLALATWVAGCNQPMEPQADDEPTEQGSGTLEITVAVSGTRPDPDGYTVTVALATQSDLPAKRVESTGGAVRFSDLPPGVHSIRLDNLAANCTVSGANPRSFTIAAEKTSRMSLAVACPGPGALLVKTVSTGVDLNSGDYTIVFEAASTLEGRIGANDSLLMSEEDLPPAVVSRTWTVRLNGIPENCLITSPNPRLAGLPGDVTTRIVFSVSCIQRSSRIAFEREGDIFLALVGSGTVNVTNHPAADVSPALSPDRSRIVFSSNRDDPSGNPSDLYVVNVDGSGLVRLTNSAGGDWVGSQAWSPDESKIVFTSYRDDPNGEIYVMNADGSGVVRLTRDGASDINPAWSPDGSSIAFCSNRVSEWQFDIYRMSASGGSSVKVASDGCDPAWSPDGSKIAYITGTDPDMSIPDLAVIGVDGAGFVQLHPFSISFTDRSSRPSWSPDGSWIAFTRDWDSTVVIIPFDGENFGASIDLRRGASPSWR